METMRTCIKCGRLQPIENYYRNKPSLGGRLRGCKQCFKISKRIWRAKSRRALTIYFREWHRKNTEKKASYWANWVAANPLKAKAQKDWTNYKHRHGIKTGKCQVCGSRRNVQAHHEDYNFPLSITWLCSIHHAAWHKAFIPIGGK